jgi:hypothetical protein
MIGAIKCVRARVISNAIISEAVIDFHETGYGHNETRGYHAFIDLLLLVDKPGSAASEPVS